LLIQNYIEYSNRKFHLAKSTEHGASTQPILVILRNLIAMTMAMEVIIIIFMLSKLGKYLITGGEAERDIRG
jgi:hypothetical protein